VKAGGLYRTVDILIQFKKSLAFFPQVGIIFGLLNSKMKVEIEQ
jgi:hypothetical protein